MKIGACYGTWGFESYLNRDAFQWQPTYSSHGESNIIEVEGYPVVSDSRVVWNTSVSAGNNSSYLWNTALALSNSNSLLWNVSASVSGSKQLVWNVAQAIASAKQLVWNVLYGSIYIDSSSNSGYQTTSSYSWSHTCGGNNRFLVVDISIFSISGVTVSGITYNGVALTFIGAKTSNPTSVRVESWGLIAPATGTNTIAVTLSGTDASIGTAVSYTGVNQSSPTEAFNSAEGTNVGAADATVTITTVTNVDWVHGAICTGDTSITANQTTRNNASGVLGSGANEDTGPVIVAGPTVISYTDVGAGKIWAIAGFGIKPSVSTIEVTNLVQLLWNTRQISSNAESLLWNVRQTCSNYDIFLWNTRQAVSSSEIIIWNVLSAVTKPESFLWNVAQALSSNKVLLWNTSQVSSCPKDIVWNTRQAISSSDSLLWNTLLALAKSEVLIWNTSKAISASDILLWNTRQLSQSSKNLLWNVAQAISQNSSLIWNTLLGTSKSSAILWNLAQNSYSSESLSWNVYQLTDAELDILWNVISDVVPSFKIKYYNLVITQEILSNLIINQNLDHTLTINPRVEG